MKKRGFIVYGVIKEITYFEDSGGYRRAGVVVEVDRGDPYNMFFRCFEQVTSNVSAGDKVVVHFGIRSILFGEKWVTFLNAVRIRKRACSFTSEELEQRDEKRKLKAEKRESIKVEKRRKVKDILDTLPF